MNLTQEQKNAVSCSQNILLTACPGSGKTGVITAKLMVSIDDVRDTPRRLACITYTNSAVDEIEDQVAKSLMPGDGCGMRRVRYESLYYDYADFAGLNINVDGKAIGSALTSGIAARGAVGFWKRCRSRGYIDFCNLLYLSLRLLRRFPEIADGIASRYALILADEFQDTTDVQVEILTAIAGRARNSSWSAIAINQSMALPARGRSPTYLPRALMRDAISRCRGIFGRAVLLLLTLKGSLHVFLRCDQLDQRGFIRNQRGTSWWRTRCTQLLITSYRPCKRWASLSVRPQC